MSQILNSFRATLGILGMVGMMMLVNPATSYAQMGECAGGACGTPDTSGGGCGCGCGCSILIAQTDLGDTYQYSDDFDNDGWEDDFDNCPFAANGDQGDSDGDGFGDSCDNCRLAANPSQTNADGDLMGDGCDDDADGDSIPNVQDNCWLFPNPNQVNGGDDADTDGLGNLCDNDDDNDGVLDPSDNCPLVNNPAQDPGDPASLGSRCRTDEDQDGIPDSFDSCPTINSLDVRDSDQDGMGDACDEDWDNDGVFNLVDNCRNSLNPTQVDGDRDGLGDNCDPKFCFTIDSAEANRCLDPEAPFFTRPGPDAVVKTGEPLRLRLFSNRAQTAIRYTWAVESSPSTRAASIQNPRGAVTNSSPWEYRYTTDRTPWFIANEPGEYVVRLESELVFDDAKGFSKRSDLQTMKITVEGARKLPIPGINNCSNAGDSFSVISALAILGLVIRRRR
jgi:hypothetical protein